MGKKQLGNRNKGYNRKRNLERKIINKNNIYSFSSVSAMVAITDLMRTFEELKEVIVELTIRGWSFSCYFIFWVFVVIAFVYSFVCFEDCLKECWPHHSEERKAAKCIRNMGDWKMRSSARIRGRNEAGQVRIWWSCSRKYSQLLLALL